MKKGIRGIHTIQSREIALDTIRYKIYKGAGPKRTLKIEKMYANKKYQNKTFQ